MISESVQSSINLQNESTDIANLLIDEIIDEAIEDSDRRTFIIQQEIRED